MRLADAAHAAATLTVRVRHRRSPSGNGSGRSTTFRVFSATAQRAHASRTRHARREAIRLGNLHVPSVRLAVETQLETEMLPTGFADELEQDLALRLSRRQGRSVRHVKGITVGHAFARSSAFVKARPVAGRCGRAVCAHVRRSRHVARVPFQTGVFSFRERSVPLRSAACSALSLASVMRSPAWPASDSPRHGSEKPQPDTLSLPSQHTRAPVGIDGCVRREAIGPRRRCFESVSCSSLMNSRRSSNEMRSKRGDSAQGRV
jgi:hypothetical protein